VRLRCLQLTRRLALSHPSLQKLLLQLLSLLLHLFLLLPDLHRLPLHSSSGPLGRRGGSCCLHECWLWGQRRRTCEECKDRVLRQAVCLQPL